MGYAEKIAQEEMKQGFLKQRKESLEQAIKVGSDIKLLKEQVPEFKTVENILENTKEIIKSNLNFNQNVDGETLKSLQFCACEFQKLIDKMNESVKYLEQNTEELKSINEDGDKYWLQNRDKLKKKVIGE